MSQQITQCTYWESIITFIAGFDLRRWAGNIISHFLRPHICFLLFSRFAASTLLGNHIRSDYLLGRHRMNDLLDEKCVDTFPQSWETNAIYVKRKQWQRRSSLMLMAGLHQCFTNPIDKPCFMGSEWGATVGKRPNKKVLGQYMRNDQHRKCDILH